MSMKKKIVAAGLVACVAATAIGGATLAYFTDTQDVSNTFTVGNVSITLDEAQVQKVGDEWVALDERVSTGVSYDKVYPNAQLPKDPMVTLGADSSDAYVRVKVTFTNYNQWVAAMGQTPVNSVLGTIGNGWTLDETASANGTFVYVYSPKLTADDVDTPEKENVTTAVFSSVTIPHYFDGNDMANIATGGEFQINVQAEAIQADGFDSAADAFAELDGQGTQP